MQTFLKEEGFGYIVFAFLSCIAQSLHHPPKKRQKMRRRIKLL